MGPGSDGQEGFLVLAGECTLIVEEQERPLRQWDYFHCPPDTRHITVGAGDGPCAILMIGLRPDVEVLHYPVSEVAARYGASAAKETNDPDEAYADRDRARASRHHTSSYVCNAGQTAVTTGR